MIKKQIQFSRSKSYIKMYGAPPEKEKADEKNVEGFFSKILFQGTKS